MRPRIIGTPAPAAQPQQVVDATVTELPSFLPKQAQSLGDLTVAGQTAVVAPTPTKNWDGQLVVPENFGVGLTQGQADAILRDVNQLSIHNLALLDIARLSADAQTTLHQSLGVFLDRIDKGNNPQLFRLVSELNREVKAQDLGGVADKILDGKPSAWARLMGKLSAEKRDAAMSEFMEQLRGMVSAKTVKISSVLDKMEKDVEKLQQIAIGEAQNFEALKANYRKRFGEFALAVVFMTTFLAKAKDELALLEAQEAAGTMPPGMTVLEARAKLQALESRALAVETTFTKLPAEQLVITQLQTALIQTVQESTTTMSGRFADIKMNLVAIHGAMQAQNLQRAGELAAQLDANMAAVRSRLTKAVVTTAANAPGNNRLRAAEMLKQVVTDTQELQKAVEQAEADNKVKFAQAGEMLSTARQDLTALGAVIRPDQQLKF